MQIKTSLNTNLTHRRHPSLAVSRSIPESNYMKANKVQTGTERCRSTCISYDMMNSYDMMIMMMLLMVMMIMKMKINTNMNTYDMMIMMMLLMMNSSFCSA